jgi:hypothetical protein
MACARRLTEVRLASHRICRDGPQRRRHQHMQYSVPLAVANQACSSSRRRHSDSRTHGLPPGSCRRRCRGHRRGRPVTGSGPRCPRGKTAVASPSTTLPTRHISVSGTSGLVIARPSFWKCWSKPALGILISTTVPSNGPAEHRQALVIGCLEISHFSRPQLGARGPAGCGHDVKTQRPHRKQPRWPRWDTARLPYPRRYSGPAAGSPSEEVPNPMHATTLSGCGSR